ncbi:hypothetical protein LJY25_17425 [Hymenobacter sp. BT175]|uniref:hypothetical protein n=1 Tax=Hymenobacter translucens TaxID=2886507 RepID=UPI001D0DEA3E|nr:hypothetical protein [Hymenobacter translucens]MCC2548235.1 hypothetical protein [Hymenobacter translucens]
MAFVLARFLPQIPPRTLFLVDGLGGLLSAVLLAGVLPATRLGQAFGMPLRVLHLLGALAFGFCAYSLLHYWRLPANWPPRLQAIAVANLLYCGLSAGLVLYLLPQLSALALLYFALEIVVVGGLAIMELQAAKSSPDRPAARPPE